MYIAIHPGLGAMGRLVSSTRLPFSGGGGGGEELRKFKGLPAEKPGTHKELNGTRKPAIKFDSLYTVKHPIDKGHSERGQTSQQRTHQMYSSIYIHTLYKITSERGQPLYKG